MKAVICPVCNGVGRVSPGFYNRAGDCATWVSAGGELELCRSCNGGGWVEVREDPADIRPYILPNPVYRYYYPNPIYYSDPDNTWYWATT